MTTQIDGAAKTVWEYLCLPMDIPPKIDVAVVLGSRDDRVASHAAHILRSVKAGQVCISGGLAHRDDLLRPPEWSEASEAEHFAAVMRCAGYAAPVLLETEATNTGENATLVCERLRQSGVYNCESVLIVTKPYMERRALRTFEAQWTVTRRDGSLPHIYVASWQTSLDDYVSDGQPFDDVVNIMVGDLQRIIDYPRRGFMTPSVVPRAVIEAYEVLIRAGFTQHSLQ